MIPVTSGMFLVQWWRCWWCDVMRISPDVVWTNIAGKGTLTFIFRMHWWDGMVRCAGKGWVPVTRGNDTVCVQWWWCLMDVMCEKYRLVWYGLILLARGCCPTSLGCMGEMHHLPGLGSSFPPFPFQRVTQCGLGNKEPRVALSPSLSLYLNLEKYLSSIFQI